MASSTNILFLPFRKTHSLALSDAIKQYISTKYDQHPDMFLEDLQVIDRLRQDAATVREPHLSGIKKIAAYAAQLSWIGGKFPIDVRIIYPLWEDLLMDGNRLVLISLGTQLWDTIRNDRHRKTT